MPPVLARGVEALRADDADAALGEGSGAGTAACFAVGTFAVVLDAAEIGASGVGTLGAGSATRFALGALGAVVGAEVLTVEVWYAGGGSSGAGIGVPPAAQPFAAHARAARQAPMPSTPPLSRRDDVHMDIPSLPFEPHRTSEGIFVSTVTRGAAAGCPAAAPHVTTQRFCFFFLPPWIARLHAPPRWSSHEPWPDTCRESEP